MHTTAQDLLDLQQWEHRKGFVSDQVPKSPKRRPGQPRYSPPRGRYAKTKRGRPPCPACASNWAQKKGNRADKGRPDIQRWQCASCGRRFTTRPHPEPAIVEER